MRLSDFVLLLFEDFLCLQCKHWSSVVKVLIEILFRDLFLPASFWLDHLLFRYS